MIAPAREDTAKYLQPRIETGEYSPHQSFTSHAILRRRDKRNRHDTDMLQCGPCSGRCNACGTHNRTGRIKCPKHNGMIPFRLDA